jgi:hypothetical protein
MYRNGRGTIASWAGADREGLARRPPGAVHLNMTVRVRPVDRILPSSRSLRTLELRLDPVYREGAFEAAAGDQHNLVEVRWPDGWSVLQAVVSDYGLEARRSAPGRVAAALLKRLGSLQELHPLVDEELLRALAPLGESNAMSWFRARTREIAAAAAAGGQDPGAQLAAIEAALADLRVPPRGESDRPELTYDSLRPVFANHRRQTETWLAWAEEQGLLVRGVGVACRACGASSWRGVGELAPPLICSGCGRPIAQPFRSPDHLKFRYRASEPLLQVLGGDTLVHLLTMRFWCGLFADSFRPSQLYGAYPGVEFFEPGGTESLAEADVLLVFTSGRLVPIECKTRAGGLTAGELTKLEQLSERLNAPWSVVATLDRASRLCAYGRASPGRLSPRRWA